MNLIDPQRTRAPEDKFEQLIEVLDDMPTVMVVASPNATLAAARARPMSVAKRGDDGTLYFLTSATTSLVQELRKDDLGMCTGQNKTQYVSLAGIFNVVEDRALIEELWSAMAEAWFPKGKQDPDIRVIVFRPTTAELWDMSGKKGIGYFIDVAKAWLTKEPPKGDADVHTRVAVTEL